MRPGKRWGVEGVGAVIPAQPLPDNKLRATSLRSARNHSRPRCRLWAGDHQRERTVLETTPGLNVVTVINVYPEQQPDPGILRPIALDHHNHSTPVEHHTGVTRHLVECPSNMGCLAGSPTKPKQLPPKVTVSASTGPRPNVSVSDQRTRPRPASPATPRGPVAPVGPVRRSCQLHRSHRRLLRTGETRRAGFACLP